MAVPTVVGVGTAAAGTGAVTPTLPSGWAEDDILLLFVETDKGEAVTVDGWSAAPNTPYDSTGLQTNTRLTVLWKRAGSSESDPTTSDSGDHQIAGIMAVRGCVTTYDPFLVSSCSNVFTNFTTYISDVLVVNAGALGTDGLTTGQFSSWTNATLSSLTERFDEFTDVGNGGGFGVATGEKATAGPVNGTTVTQSAEYYGGVYWTGALIADSYDGKPFIRSIGSAQGNTAAVDLLTPPQYFEDDVFLAFVETADEAVTATGWTEAGSSPASNAGTNPTRLTVFYKRAAASEGSNLGSTSDSGEHQVARVMCIGGATSASDPFSATASSTGGTDTAITIPGATTTQNDCLVIAAAATTRRSSSTTTFSSWTNADLTGLTEIFDNVYNLGIPAGGGIGAAYGYKDSAGTYGSTSATQATSVEYAAWTGAIMAEPTGVTGISADHGELTLASDSTLLIEGRAISGLAENLTLTGGDAVLRYGFSLQAQAGAMSLAEGRYKIEAGNPAKSELIFLIDLVPAAPTGTYQRYSERLRIGGVDVPLVSWDYTENAASVGGKLRFEIADVSQRPLFTSNASVTFEIGVWNGSEWTWTSLLDTGTLENSQYVLRSDASGPRDSFSVSAMSEMEDRLASAPAANTVFYDPDQNTATIFNLPAVVNVDGTSTPAQKVEITGMDLYSLLDRIFVTECGFGDFVTNLPNFRIYSFDCEAGVPYTSAVSGLVGMFNPTYSAYRRGGTLVLALTDGTVARSPGMPAARAVRISGASALGLSSEFANDGVTPSAALSIGSLELTLNQTGLESDWQSSAERYVNETVTTGTIGEDGGEYTEQEIRKRYLDRYSSEYGDAPFRSDLMDVSVTTYMTKEAAESYKRAGFEVSGETGETVYSGPIEIEAGEYETLLIETSFERFTYENGELAERYKRTSGSMPLGRALPGDEGGADESGVEYYLYEGDSHYPYQVRPMLSEYERITRRWHPYIPGRLYIAEREVVQDGLVVVDAERDLAGRAYMRPALEASRGGNLMDGQTTDWVRISSVKETFTPNGDGTVSVSKTESDYLAEQVSFNESRIDDGQIGYNARAGRQEKLTVSEEGVVQPAGRVARMNAGQLPLSLAVAVGRRRLRLARRVRETYSLEVIGIDTTLQQGSLVEAYGREDEHLGTFVVEARTMSGRRNSYTMTLEAKSATTYGGTR